MVMRRAITIGVRETCPNIATVYDVDDKVVPCRPLLIRINDTHQNGLETEEDQE